MMRATIRDVAQRAGVGLGTVSRVLNNSPLVSPETRQRVLEVIDELQYTPNPIARSLSLGKTLTIAVIAPFFTRPSVVERLRGIEAALANSGYNLVVFNIESAERRDACLREIPRKERSDGVLLISLPPRAEEISTIKLSGVPLVLIDTYAPGLPYVVIDNKVGGYIATRHLLELGHQRIAYVSDPLEDPFSFGFTSSYDRYQGYRKALREAGIIFHENYHVSGLHGRYEARRLAHALLSQPEPPTAIFAASDTQAMGVLEAARDQGVDIPGELSVIGFDDIDVAEYLGLTTIRQPLFESGVRGVEALLNLINAAEDWTATLVCERLSVELVVRKTTAVPAA
ncbi:MAG: LacI family transcriptional regulator [Chloroflexales bacterium]|nr:LacI family transcriptional regulator [Chloroflexales bacterium]